MAKKTSMMANRIRRRICDEPMARKKGYLPCEKKCDKCLAALQINNEGVKEHTPDRR